MTKHTPAKSTTGHTAGTGGKPVALPEGVTATNSSTPGLASLTGAATQPAAAQNADGKAK